MPIKDIMTSPKLVHYSEIPNDRVERHYLPYIKGVMNNNSFALELITD